MVLLSLATHPDTVVVHFNHGLRDTAARDAKIVEEAAKHKNFTYEEIHLHLTTEENLQDQARKLRYQNLIQIANKYRIYEVALGHHGDDLVESMLLHLVRGTSIKGLQMRSHFHLDGVAFIRPLLSVSKQDLLAYALSHNIPYAHDESNDSDAYLRNRIRHHVIPVLQEEQPQLLEKFSQLSEQVQDLLPLLDQLTNDVFDTPLRSTYQQLPSILQKHVLGRWLDHHDISAHQALLDQMNEVLHSASPHQEVTLSKSLRLQTSYDTVRFVTNVTSVDFMQKINAPGTYEGPNHDIVIVTTDPLENADYDAIVSLSTPEIFPLELRYRQPGDLVYLTGGRKKLKDWLIDLKVDQQDRNQLLLLAQGSDVLWIPSLNYQSSKKGQVQIYCSWRPQQ